MSGFVAGLSVSEHSQIFLFTPDETLLAHPSQRVATDGAVPGQGKMLTLSDTGDPLVAAFQQHLRPEYLHETSASPDGDARTKLLGSGSDRARDGRDGFHFFQFERDGVDYMASTTVFPVGDGQSWIVGAVAPASDFLASVWRTRWLALAAAAGAIGLAIALAAILSQRISGPVEALIAFMQRVGDGDLHAKADFHGAREFHRLSIALNKMITDLRDRLRLRQSLDIAMEVQQQLLPQHPPKVAGFDLAGHSTYCDETGGDYFDFLLFAEQNNDQVLVALGDVMGHGVAAALVMAGARAVLRDRAQTSGSLAALIGRLNRMIAADMQGSRFMTMHLGMLDAKKGIYRFVSAGHDPAICYDRTTGKFHEQECSSMPLGIMDDVEYEEQEYPTLAPGQILFIGTDGVWEMPNAAGEQYGKQRLRDVISQTADQTAEQIAAAARSSRSAARTERSTM